MLVALGMFLMVDGYFLFCFAFLTVQPGRQTAAEFGMSRLCGGLFPPLTPLHDFTMRGNAVGAES